MKKTSLSVVCLLIWISLYGQTDTLSADTLTNKLKRLVAACIQKTPEIDTSDYEVYILPGALDINLQIAASRGYCTEILRLIVQGADVNNMVGENATPLHYAVASGSREAAEILLLLTASPDAVDIYGNTPLIVAVKAQDLEMAELLVRYGAALSGSDRREATPLHHAVALGLFYISDMLLYYGAPLEVYDEDGDSPLMVSVWSGYYDITDILLKAGANPENGDRKGITPLMLAAQLADTLMMRILIDAGANLYSIDNEGFDALSYATTAGSNDAVTFLLTQDSRWASNALTRRNPADIAIANGHKELLPELKESGFKTTSGLSLDEIRFYTGGMATAHYALLSAGISIREPRIRAGFTAGVSFNPSRWRLLTKDDGDIIYQYKVATSVVYAGIFKEFLLDNYLWKGRLSFSPSISAGYRMYSDYSGTRQKPESSFCIVPSADLDWSRRHFGIKAGVSYLNTPFYKVPPIWVSLGLTLSFNRGVSESPEKKIRIYDYE